MPTTLNQNPSAVEKGAVQKESNAGWGYGLGGCAREAGLREAMRLDVSGLPDGLTRPAWPEILL